MMSTDQLVEFERVMSYAAVDFSIAYRAADYAAQKHTPMERPQAGPASGYMTPPTGGKKSFEDRLLELGTMRKAIKGFKQREGVEKPFTMPDDIHRFITTGQSTPEMRAQAAAAWDKIQRDQQANKEWSNTGGQN